MIAEIMLKTVITMSVKCPRCGEEMTGGICNNCGFPLTKMMKKFNNGDVLSIRKVKSK